MSYERLTREASIEIAKMAEIVGALDDTEGIEKE
jgi:hypothetical protein